MNTGSWKFDLLNTSIIMQEVFTFENDIYICKSLSQNEITTWRYSEFAQRALIPYTTTWCEQQLGEQILRQALSIARIKAEDIVMDLGCSDGRYVRYLLSQGYQRIVALNYELEPLVSLKKSLSEDEKTRVFLVCADIMNNPFLENSADFVLAWSLFTSTPDFHNTMDACINLLKSGSYLFNAEPVLEHALIYALVMNNPDEFLRTLITKTRPRMWNDKETRYRVYTIDELNFLMTVPSLKLVATKGINVLPSILYGGVLAGKKISEEYKDILWQAILENKTQWYRQLTFLSKKKMINI